MTDWTPARATALRAFAEEPLFANHGDMRVGREAAAAALGEIDRLRVELTRLQNVEKERDAIMDAVHPKRRESKHDWTPENIATLASAHREDSETVDETDTYDDYGVISDLDAARLLRRQRLEAAERVQEGLRAERDQAIIDRDYNRVVSDEHRKTAMQCRKEMRDMLSRADAEAIAVKVFEAAIENGKRADLGFLLGEWRDALRRAFHGSAEPPTPGVYTTDVSAEAMDGPPIVTLEPVSAPERPTLETPTKRCWICAGDPGGDSEGREACLIHGWRAEERRVGLELRLANRQLERFAICPDHRDKGTGDRCIVCKFEASARREEHAHASARAAAMQRDTLARARAAVQALQDRTNLTAPAWNLAIHDALRALDALAVSASDHTQEPG